MTRFSKREIKTVIFALKDGKSPGYDVITGTLLKNVPEKGFIFLTYLYNAIFRLCFIGSDKNDFKAWLSPIVQSVRLRQS